MACEERAPVLRIDSNNVLLKLTPYILKGYLFQPTFYDSLVSLTIFAIWINNFISIQMP